MPGHFGEEDLLESQAQKLQELEQLIAHSDILLNCFDSREARYFPCLLGSIYNKPVLSLGIGFDSFVSIIQSRIGDS